MEIKLKKRYIPFVLCCLGIYAFPFILRDRIFSQLSNINFVFYTGVFMAIASGRFRLQTRTNSSIWRNGLFVAFLFSSSFLIFWVYGTNWSTIFKIKMVFTFTLPAIFLVIGIPKMADKNEFLNRWYQWLKVVCYLLVLLWFVDWLTGHLIQRLFVSLYQSDTLSYLLQSGRYVSFYGHSLENAYMFMIFLVWTLVRKEAYLAKRNFVVNIGVALFGIAISGSKSGLIIAILLIVVVNLGLRHFKYLIAIIAAVAALYAFGVFDMVLARLVEGMASGDLSTYRNIALTQLLQSGRLQFEMILGHEIEYNNPIMIAALEYPVLLFAYRNGILFTMIMYLVYFIYPTIRLVLCKNWRILACVIALMVFVNGNNGIGSYNDDLLIYAINVGLMLLCVEQSMDKERKR